MPSLKSEIWKVDATFKGILLNPVQTEQNQSFLFKTISFMAYA